MSKKQLLALLGVAIILVGDFLPFFKGIFASISLWDGDDGKIVLIAAILAAVAILLRWNTIAIIICLIAALTAIMDMADGSDKGFDLGIGGYVIIAGVVIAVVGTIAAMGDKRKTSRAKEPAS